MRVVIAGRIGATGQKLIRHLQAQGHHLLLIGSKPDVTISDLGNIATAGSPTLATAGRGYDLLVYLAETDDAAIGIAEPPPPASMLSEQAHLAGIERLVYLAAPDTPAADPQPIEDLGFETLELPPLASSEAGVASHDELGLNRLIESIVMPVQDLDGTQVAVMPQDSNTSFRILKRVIDLALAIGLVLTIWWAMIIIWAAVRLQSPGPGIYRQPRIGQNGRVFTCLKFRTMLLSTPDRGTHEISDTAVTGLGRFLRRTKLDELPQVFNVIRNEMTFVGPRPSLPSQSEVVIERQKRGVLQAKPGITGLAQINGIDMSDPVRLAEYDQRYLELQSPRLDFQIMLATLVGRGGGDRTRK